MMCGLAVPVLLIAAGCGASAGGTAGVASTAQPAAQTVTVTRTATGTTPAPITVTATVELTVTVKVGHTVTRTVTVGTDLNTRVFDEDKVAAGVEKILTDAPPAGYGQTDVTNVQCPPNEPVKAGRNFLCTMQIDGRHKSVTITVKDDSGTYEVGVPQ